MVNWIFGAFLTLLALILAIAVYRFVRFRGIAGVAFGAPVVSTIGEAQASDFMHIATVAKVHRLSGSAHYHAVGLEFSARVLGSSRFTAFTLSHEEANRLGHLLIKAAGQPGESTDQVQHS